MLYQIRNNKTRNAWKSVRMFSTPFAEGESINLQDDDLYEDNFHKRSTKNGRAVDHWHNERNNFNRFCDFFGVNSTVTPALDSAYVESVSQAIEAEFLKEEAQFMASLAEGVHEFCEGEHREEIEYFYY